MQHSMMDSTAALMCALWVSWVCRGCADLVEDMGIQWRMEVKADCRKSIALAVPSPVRKRLHNQNWQRRIDCPAVPPDPHGGRKARCPKRLRNAANILPGCHRSRSPH